MSDGASPTGEAGHPAMTDRAARRTAPLTRTAFAFDEHIDGREAGIEPGTECSEAIEGLFGRGERTVLALDAGTYWVEASIVLRGTRSVGIVAKAGGKGDFEVPADYDRSLLRIADVEHALLAGIDVDQRAPGAHPELGVSVESSFLIEDVGIRGIGDTTGGGSRMPLCVEAEHGIDVLRRV